MYKNNLKNKFLLISIILAGILFQGCKTTRSITKGVFAPEAPDDSTFIVAHDVVFPETEGEYKYIFFRLYNPIYKNPLYIANILKGGINTTRMNNDPEVSHASINFSLNDNYYGLALAGEHQLSPEECVIPESNEYMKKCDPEKSEQITYALKVTEEEYEQTKKFVQTYVDRNEIKYATGLNFKIALFCIKRKFFTPKQKQEFGSLIYPNDVKNKKVNLREDKKIKNDFVCSTFIGYVLYNNVESVSSFFDEHNIKYEYLNVADIGQIPGIVPIFYSNWDNYLEAAHAFVEEYPEFKEYLTEE